jgi:OOP family OmpA-OmpF porin
MKRGKNVVRGIAGVLIIGLVSCNQGPVMRGQIAGLSKLASQAERNGAIRCAPRELAVAKSQLKFAEVELDQGFISRASKHLSIAEPNAHAAYDLSPPEKCAERGLVMTPIDEDTDGDGIPDSRDMCVLEPEDKDGYLDEDGCPDPDNDLDGIHDTVDKCPNEPEDPDGFEDADGCPDPDNDKDNVADVDDQCPNEPGPPDGDRPGCPRKPALVVVTDK